MKNQEVKKKTTKKENIKDEVTKKKVNKTAKKVEDDIVEKIVIKEVNSSKKINKGDIARHPEEILKFKLDKKVYKDCMIRVKF